MVIVLSSLFRSLIWKKITGGGKKKKRINEKATVVFELNESRSFV